MSAALELYWAPPPPADWRDRVKALAKASAGEAAWREAIALANFRLNFQLTNALAGAVAQVFGSAASAFSPNKPERLALLSSSTTTHLIASLKIGALRRGIWLDVYENDYGQYRQELTDPQSPLYVFAPTWTLFCLDAEHAAAAVTASPTRAASERAIETLLQELEALWRLAKERLGASVLQQTLMPRLPAVMGANEHRYPGSAAAFIEAVNARLRPTADAAGVDLLALDSRIALDGLAAWHSRAVWLKAKQEIALPAGPLYGDLVARALAAARGLTKKCLVLDLDNTLWGGVIGDDGVNGIVVGQGSARGEAFLAVQRYARQLRQRGVIIAVCSKNDDEVARRAFRDNPEMLLKESDFACFKANWEDKASNLRAIARELNIGLDALVFVDDNPFERELIRRELPMVSTPEVGEDVEAIPQCLADAGYFEAIALTPEDYARADYYSRPRLGGADGADITDMAGYLAELDMRLVWGPVNAASLVRSAQLVNKTNQFNLTTRRYSEAQIRAMADDPTCACLQFRLLDRFGDNGLIAVVIGKLNDDALVLDTWLMSCRVLGRGVEAATLNVIAATAKTMGARRLRGVFLPTAKNAMVARHYERLGFVVTSDRPEETESELELGSFTPRATPICIAETKA